MEYYYKLSVIFDQFQYRTLKGLFNKKSYLGEGWGWFNFQSIHKVNNIGSPRQLSSQSDQEQYYFHPLWTPVAFIPELNFATKNQKSLHSPQGSFSKMPQGLHHPPYTYMYVHTHIHVLNSYFAIFAQVLVFCVVQHPLYGLQSIRLICWILLILILI